MPARRSRPRSKTLPQLPRLMYTWGRDGEPYAYYRAGGRLAPIPERPIGSPAFIARYNELHQQHQQETSKAACQSLAALIEAYLGSNEFAKLGARTQAEYRHYLGAMQHGDAGKIDAANEDAVRSVLHGAHKLMADRPAAANRMLTVAGVLYQWARFEDPKRFRDVNPAKSIRRHASSNDGGRRPWTHDEIAAVDATASPEVRAALVLARYTGLRLGDLCRLSWTHYDGQKIRIVTSKRKVTVAIPCLSAVRKLLDEMRGNASPFDPILRQASGARWLEATLSHKVTDTIRNAGCEGIVLHGLRKNAGVMLAHAGCTPHEIAAILGCSVQNALHYTRLADMERLSESAMRRVEMLDEYRARKAE